MPQLSVQLLVLLLRDKIDLPNGNQLLLKILNITNTYIKLNKRNILMELFHAFVNKYPHQTKIIFLDQSKMGKLIMKPESASTITIRF